MPKHSRWEDFRNGSEALAPEVRAEIDRDLALGQLVYDLRSASGLSQRGLAERMAVAESVVSRLEEGGRASNRIDILARVAVALDRHLVLSFPRMAPARLNDAVQIT